MMHEKNAGVAMAQFKILVTGADGFLGSHLTETLVRKGHRVRTLIFEAPWQPAWLQALPAEILSELETVSGDIRQREQIGKALQGQEQVYHLAAETREAGTQLLMETHVTGTLNVLHAALEQDAHVVLASTHEVYGRPLYQPVDEKHPLQGNTARASSRLAGETLATSFARSFQLSLSIARLFEVYGPRQSPDHVLSDLLLRFIAASPDSSFTCPDLSLAALFVSDAVAALVACGLQPAASGKTFNIGSSERLETVQLLNILMQHSQKNLELEPEQTFYAAPFPTCDASKAREVLGWQTQVDWAEGLGQTLAALSLQESAQ